MNKISLSGIRTHNLKNINVDIPIGKITVIYGRSGSGKSSLAFSSIYQLCKDEFDSIENGHLNESDYQISFYEGLIPAVSIPQSNLNTNPYSTIYSYLNISQAVSSLKTRSELAIPDYTYLKLNKHSNICKNCNGLGFVVNVDEDELINISRKINERPFSCWNNGELADYYNQLLFEFCKENNIDTNSTFASLSQVQKDMLLYSQSEKKIVFKCKHKGKNKQRRAFFRGAMLFSESKVKKNQSVKKYGKEGVCLCCKGSRINNNLAELNILGISFQQLLLLPISKLCVLFKKMINKSFLYRVLESINEIGLGYLNLSRSIPSLSGGELQKLMFSRLLTSNITGILIVIDEISAQINPVDYPKILQKIKNIAQKNSLILVEHNQYFIDQADQKIHIGKFAGSAGGTICEDEIICALRNTNTKNKIREFYEFKQISKNNVINQSVSIPKNCVTVFSGVSGSGKSSLAKGISELTNSIYISQKLPSYTGRSSVASITELNKLVADFFSKETGINMDFFLPHKNGGCKCCEGKGVIKYERGYEKDIYVTCHHCNGMLFEPNLIETNIDVKGFNIQTIYNTELHNLINFFGIDKIDSIISTLNDLGLSHLKLNRKTQSLSGGEIRRVKLCEILSKAKKISKILIIDEPVAGLDPETASKVLNYIYSKSNVFNAIIVIEHRQEINDFADYKIEIGPYSGENGGVVINQRVLLS